MSQREPNTLTFVHGPYDGSEITLAPWRREIVVKQFESSPTAYLYRVANEDDGSKYLAFCGAVDGVTVG